MEYEPWKWCEYSQHRQVCKSVQVSACTHMHRFSFSVHGVFWDHPHPKPEAPSPPEPLRNLEP